MLKVCGATTREEVDLLAAVGADLVGLWHGVPGGPADLSVTKLAALAAVARASEGIEPVVVTFLSDANTLAGLLARTGALGPAPRLPAARRRAGDQGRRAGCSRGEGPPPPGRHLHRGQRFVGAYERAGTDCFLLDAATEDGRVAAPANDSTARPSPASPIA